MSDTLLEHCAFLAASAAGNPTHYMVEQALTQAELEWRFLSFEAADTELARALDGLDVLGFRGVLLSAEYRGPAVELLDMLTPRAERAGSVDCLVRSEGKLLGDNLYGAAFVESLGDLSELSVLVVGDGRVARTVAAAAGDGGAQQVFLAGDDITAIESMKELLSVDTNTVYEMVPMDDNVVHAPATANVMVFAPDSDEVVDRPLIDTSATSGTLTIVDTRLRGSPTGLLKFATEQGATIIDGVELFARETALALELWTGMRFDRAPLQELAEEFLGV
ncbi:hypothetical protein [Aeoliella mucimassa]|uniref:Shikimate dehydrogenase n=1 Tax=Aeoliella mucimassa TaxID=2527972 RepID=A0A518AIA4_9BACT|nr:hypothetical protein [Aeoliella mucimassa]QDU54457.1 Shikimate dehydrogenase [Aeoliella mucimassa]